MPIFGYTSMYLHNCCHIMYDVVKVHVKTFVVKLNHNDIFLNNKLSIAFEPSTVSQNSNKIWEYR